MKLNKQKCGILQLGGRGNTLSKNERKLKEIADVPYVSQYKYLGIRFNKSMNPQLQLENL